MISDEISRAKRGLTNILDKKKIKRRILQLESETRSLIDAYCSDYQISEVENVE